MICLLVSALKRFWSLASGVVFVLFATLGEPSFIDLTNKWVVFACAVAVFVLGYLFGVGEGRRSEAARRERGADDRERKRIEGIARSCRTLSKRQRAMLLKGLDDGAYTLNFQLDADASSLLAMGFMKSSPAAGFTIGSTAHINPKLVDELDEHRAEWLGTMEDSERDEIIRRGEFIQYRSAVSPDEVAEDEDHHE